MRATEAILTGFVILALLLIGTGATSTWRLYELGEAVDGIIQQNYVSIQAARFMEQELVTINSLYTDRILAGETVSAKKLEASQKRFLDLLSKAQTNITVPGEGEILTYMRQEFREFMDWSGVDFSEDPPPTASHYQQRVSPKLKKLQDSLHQLLRLNETALHQGRNRIQKMAQRGVIWLALLGLGGLIAAFAFYRMLVGSFLRPLQEVLSQLRRLPRERYLRLATGSRNDFAEIAAEVNRLVDQFDRTVEQIEAQRSEKQQVAQVLLEQYAGAAFVFDLRREVALANSPGRMMLLSPDFRRDLEAIEAEILEGRECGCTVELLDGTFHLLQTPLHDGTGSLIGTLVELRLKEPAPRRRQNAEETAPNSESQKQEKAEEETSSLQSEESESETTPKLNEDDQDETPQQEIS